MTVRKFAEEVVGPKVEAMDEAEQMDRSVIKALFEQGVSRTEGQLAADLLETRD